MFGSRRWGGAQPVQIRMARYETIELPESEWTTCSRCGGSGRWLMPEDAHRSEGWVPCECRGGVIKTKTIMTQKPVYRVPARRKRMIKIVSE